MTTLYKRIITNCNLLYRMIPSSSFSKSLSLRNTTSSLNKLAMSDLFLVLNRLAALSANEKK